jgi:hypothetical protein
MAISPRFAAISFPGRDWVSSMTDEYLGAENQQGKREIQSAERKLEDRR